jgi:iron-sulfur cluster repair protein YtfE (RIC family)
MAEPLRTEHDHLELSAAVAELREVVRGIERAPTGLAASAATFEKTIHQLVDGLAAHFDREEQGLFPFIARELPDARTSLERLEAAHDGVCGALLRMAELVRSPGSQGRPIADRWSTILGLFRRFDAAYSAHAREEVAFLREIGGRLDARQRAELEQLLVGI